MAQIKGGSTIGGQPIESTMGTNIKIANHSIDENAHPVATSTKNGFLSSADKIKIDLLFENNDGSIVSPSSVNGNVLVNLNEVVVYTHPANHPASIITQDSTRRFVTDAQITSWDAKIDAAIAYNRTQLDNFLNAKVDKVSGKVLSSNDFTNAEKTKLAAIATAANSTAISSINGNIKIDGVETVIYTHPDNHPASIITEDSTHRFVTDAEKVSWNAKLDSANFYSIAEVDAALLTKVDKVAGKALSTNDYTNADKTKLSDISDDANHVTSSTTNGNIKIDSSETVVYVHPSGDGNLHVPATSTTNNGKFLKAGSTAGSLSWAGILASEITTDSSRNFVANTDIANWNAKADASNVYTRSQVDASLSTKADTSIIYTKAQIDASLVNKADVSNVYTKAQVDTSLSTKANISSFMNKSVLDSLSDISGSLAYNGVAVTGNSTIDSGTSLPTANSFQRSKLFVLLGDTGVTEIASLSISAGSTANSNVTITLDGVATTVSLLTSDNTATLVASKIRSAIFSGWTTGGSGTTVTFTSTSTGARTDATYSAGSTGATGTMTTTTQGVTSTEDKIHICKKLGNDTYDWVEL